MSTQNDVRFSQAVDQFAASVRDFLWDILKGPHGDVALRERAAMLLHDARQLGEQGRDAK